MANKTLNLPHHTDVPMTMKDTLRIKVTQDCNWCYSDPKGVFGPPPDDFLAAGFVKKRTKAYGPYKPNYPGTVRFDATDPGTACEIKQTILTPHTITVST
jgi:hypothetical protein